MTQSRERCVNIQLPRIDDYFNGSNTWSFLFFSARAAASSAAFFAAAASCFLRMISASRSILLSNFTPWNWSSVDTDSKISKESSTYLSSERYLTFPRKIFSLNYIYWLSMNHHSDHLEVQFFLSLCLSL